MAQYMLQVTYSQSGWAAQIKNPANRMQQVGKIVKKMGGKLQQAWYTFGKYDLVAILDMPDDVTMGAFSMAAAAGGALSRAVTTPLMSVEQGTEMIRKAAESGYRPPE